MNSKIQQLIHSSFEKISVDKLHYPVKYLLQKSQAESIDTGKINKRYWA